MAKKRTTDSFDLERRAFNGDEKAQRILERRRKEYNKQLNTVARARINDLTHNSNITPPEKQGWTAEDEVRRKADVKKYLEEKKLKELEEERKKHESGKTVNGVVYVSAYTRSKPGRR